MDNLSEINRGYIDYQRAAVASPATRQTFGQRLGSWVKRLVTPIVPYVSLGALFVWAAFMLLWLGILSLLRRRPLDELHVDAIKKIDLFVDHYPFHLYPLLCKSLELAFLLKEVPKAASPTDKIVELAIGDGSLSQTMYPPNCKVVALDISPFSLRFPATMPHVRQAIISDCINPALASGSFDLLVTNNFLHHVSAKEATLDHIARIAERSIFNENTTYWSTAWPAPFLLGKLGLKDKAKEITSSIEKRFLQDLLPREKLDDIVQQRFSIVAEAAYLCANTYFLCGIFSHLMGVYGPPTPGYVKRASQSRFLGPLIRSTTKRVAKALLEFDNYQDKRTAVFVSYSCTSKSFRRDHEAATLVCPACNGKLSAEFKCSKCGTEYPSVDGMTFVLPPDLAFIHTNYVAHSKMFYEKESQQYHH
jgi:DNA-directed RNA polymerase subunit RPC12/RpoP